MFVFFTHSPALNLHTQNWAQTFLVLKFIHSFCSRCSSELLTSISSTFTPECTPSSLYYPTDKDFRFRLPSFPFTRAALLPPVYQSQLSVTQSNYISYVPPQPRPLFSSLYTRMLQLSFVQTINRLSNHPCDLIADEANSIKDFLYSLQ